MNLYIIKLKKILQNSYKIKEYKSKKKLLSNNKRYSRLKNLCHTIYHPYIIQILQNNILDDEEVYHLLQYCYNNNLENLIIIICTYHNNLNINNITFYCNLQKYNSHTLIYNCFIYGLHIKNTNIIINILLKYIHFNLQVILDNIKDYNYLYELLIVLHEHHLINEDEYHHLVSENWHNNIEIHNLDLQDEHIYY